jgi:hypothetical protein
MVIESNSWKIKVRKNTEAIRSTKAMGGKKATESTRGKGAKADAGDTRVITPTW